jgi:hypothetical protein
LAHSGDGTASAGPVPEFSKFSTISFVNNGKKNTATLRRNCSEMMFGGLLQFVGFVQNRDPYVLKRLNQRNVPYAYEIITRTPILALAYPRIHLLKP